MFVVSKLLIARSGNSYSSGILFLNMLKSRDCASASWCSITARKVKLRTNSIKLICQRAIRLVAFARLGIHSSVSWKVQSAILLSSKYVSKTMTE